MLTICFDTAREKSSEILVVAGFAGFAKVWSQFDIEWQARLVRDNLSEFHAGDFAHFSGDFVSGWKGNEPRRRALLHDLMDLIRGHGLTRFGCAVPLPIHNRLDSTIKDRFFDAYVHASLAAVDHFNHYARELRVECVRYVFEKGEREDGLRQRFREEGYNDPDFTWKKPHRTRKGFVDPGFLGLQAAGWIAYEYYLDMTKTLNLNMPLTKKQEEGRWAFQQFESLPGGAIQLVMSPDSSNMVMKIRDATRHLRNLKPHK